MPEQSAIEDRLLACKRDLHRALYRLAAAEAGDSGERLASLYRSDAVWRGSHPLDEVRGTDAIDAIVWRPLLQSFPDLERRDLIFVGGRCEDRDMVAAMGHYCGTFREDWLGIPATGRPVYLRYGEVHHVEGGRIVQSWCLWDVLDVIRQAGYWPIAPSLGTEAMWPGPITADGIVLSAQDPEQSADSIRRVLAMHGALGDFDDTDGLDRTALMNMPQKDHWHPKMMWYGPAGIGTTRGLQGFVDFHQLPFRVAFPNRQGGEQWNDHPELKQRLGGGHYIRIGDGPYAVTGGWPSVHAMHTGGGFAGVGPTGREVTMRVMDFYLLHEGLIRENWVPLDMLDLLRQMDVDVLDRMRSHFQRGARAG